MSTQIGTKAYIDKFPYQNQDSVSIAVGSPVVMNGGGTTLPGFGAVLPSTATAVLCPSLLLGVSIEASPVLVNGFGMVQGLGLCNFVLVEVNTRAASTNSFSTIAALSVGQWLSVDTVNNAFITVASNATQQLPMAVVAQTLAAQAGSATTTSDTRLVATMGLKVFLRMM